MRTRSLLCLTILLLAFEPAQAATSPSVAEGRIDLTGWNFAADGDVALLGTWDICWGQLLLHGESCATGWGPMPVRGLWVEEEDSPFGGHGVATYRLRLALPPDLDSLSLVAGSPHTSHRFFIDGVEQGGAGVVGASADSTEMGVTTHVYNLHAPGEEIEFLVQVANFEFRSGGLKRLWYLGLPDSIQRGIGLAMAREGMVLGVGVVVGLFYLLLFSLGPSERARGYFGLMCLVAGLRSIPASISGLGELIVPGAPFEVLTRFEYLGTALMLFSGGGYVRTKVLGVAPPRTTWGLQLAALALASIIVVSPFPIVLATLPIQYVIAIALAGLVVTFYGWAWIIGVRGTRLTAWASVIYLGVILHDVLRTMDADFGARIELYPYAMVLWILSEGASLLQKFYQTFARVETLSEELTGKNFDLRETEAAIVRFVPINFLRLLGSASIRDVEPGVQVLKKGMSVLDCALRPADGSQDPIPTERRHRLVSMLVEAIEPQLHHAEGFISALHADGFVALFPGEASDASAAAVELLRRIEEMGTSAGSAGEPDVGVSIGIDTGDVLFSTMGTPEHLLWDVVGEAADRAREARQIAVQHGVTLLVSGPSRQALTAGGEFDFAHVDGFLPRESGGSTEVFEARPLDPHRKH